MRSKVFVLLSLCAFVVGCGQSDLPPIKAKASEVTKGQPNPQVKEQPKEKPKEQPKPRPLTVRYQGKNAAQWAVSLADRDPIVSQEAVEPLRVIGRESVPFLEDLTLKGEMDHNRQNAIWALPLPLAKEFKATWIPLLRKAAKDSSLHVRGYALAQMGKFGYKECIPDIQAALKVETDPSWQVNLKTALKELGAK